MSANSITARVGETVGVTFDFSNELAVSWQADYQYALASFITVGPFVYEVTDAGKTASQEPEWPTTVDDTVNDGSVEWTCRDFTTAGTDTISTRSVPSITGVTVDSDAITLSTRVDATVTITATGKHELECTVTTAAGETLKHSIYIVVD